MVRTAHDSRHVFEPGLEERLRAAEAGRFTVLVDLTDQVDLERLGRSLLRPGSVSKRERRAAVIAALELAAGRQQARLRPEIDRLLAEGALAEIRPVAIVNRLIVDGTGAGILSLASSPEVGRVLGEWRSERESGRSEPEPAPPTPLGEAFVSWALPVMGVDALWRQGLTGKGVVVASIDTGVFEAHEQLRGRRLDGDRGWFDAAEGSATPSDSHGHGTSVLSVAVGANPEGRAIGVAPGASWATALANWRNHYSRSRMTLAADWVLRVARPDVLVNAWSHDEEACTDFDLPFARAWKASGIFVVFPAGNAGPGAATGESPAQLAGSFPGNAPVFSVAALSRAGGLSELSSRGPSRCGSPAFPTVSAPGDEIPQALASNPRGYALGRGTSLAAALVGGGAALLLEAEPEASPEELEAAFAASAKPIDGEGAGAGRVDLRAAFDALRRGSPR